MTTQSEKADRLKSLHAGPGIFVIANPFDIGSARLLAMAGFKALATSSAGCAFSLGQPDSSVGREKMMEHLAAIAACCDLPVSADLENGFGDDPDDAAMTIHAAAAAGVVGGSIEDATGRRDQPVYALPLAAERIRAAAEVAHALPFPFALTARAENYLVGRADLADTIRRLQAYREAGADVLYAPGLKTKADIKAVLASIDRPLNVIMGLQGAPLTVAELEDLGVRRISVGGSLARAAYGAFLNAAREVSEEGTFTYAAAAASNGELNAIFQAAMEKYQAP